MDNATQIGMNKTGAQTSPFQTPDMEDAAERLRPRAAIATAQGLDGDGEIARVRMEYIAEADPLGTVPPPGTLRGMVQTGIAKLTGKNPEVLIDKLGERLAYERTGVRLYDAFIAKCQDQRGAQTSLSVDELLRVRDDEAEHFKLLNEALLSLGADPTAQTPCADASGVMSLGILQVLTDPRTTLAQGLGALLTTELTDSASWELLVKLAEQSGQRELAQRFSAALATEQEHLSLVRLWYEREVLAQGT
jgi:bacterioferritin (cytochrome b1)